MDAEMYDKLLLSRKPRATLSALMRLLAFMFVAMAIQSFLFREPLTTYKALKLFHNARSPGMFNQARLSLVFTNKALAGYTQYYDE